jgi:alpha-glucosidase
VCWAFSNHDVVRAVSRWGHPEHHYRIARALIALLITLPGAACLYQGEELGLTEATLAHADMRDPYGINFYPAFVGRDGARTPMPWQADARFAGFTTSQAPWLPVPSEHAERAVDAQHRDQNSLLHAHRRLLHWRHHHPALRDGGFRLMDLPEPLFGFERYVKDAGDGETLIAIFNLHDAPTLLARDRLPARARIAELNDFPFETTSDSYVLPPYGAIFAHLDAVRS